MATGRYVYTTDKNRKYLVSIDTAIGDIEEFGFTKPEVDNKLDFLPRYLKMRRLGCLSVATPFNSKLKYRYFPVGKRSAKILNKDPAPFSYKGVTFQIVRFTPEKNRN